MHRHGSMQPRNNSATNQKHWLLAAAANQQQQTRSLYWCSRSLTVSSISNNTMCNRELTKCCSSHRGKTKRHAERRIKLRNDSSHSNSTWCSRSSSSYSNRLVPAIMGSSKDKHFQTQNKQQQFWQKHHRKKSSKSSRSGSDSTRKEQQPANLLPLQQRQQQHQCAQQQD